MCVRACVRCVCVRVHVRACVWCMRVRSCVCARALVTDVGLCFMCACVCLQTAALVNEIPFTDAATDQSRKTFLCDPARSGQTTPSAARPPAPA
jgi:hypothetical protein